MLTLAFQARTIRALAAHPLLAVNNELIGFRVSSASTLCLKGEGLTNARAGRFPVTIVLALITSTGTFAQSRTAQTTAKDPTPGQSTNQIVGAKQETLPKVEVFAVPQGKGAPVAAKESGASKVNVEPREAIATKAAQTEIVVDNAVIPPAPIIVKRTANAIGIPFGGAAAAAKSDSTNSDSKTNSEAKYEERPAVASSASVGSVFGYRRDPFTRREKFHSGVDIKARWGDPVGASQAGIVQFAGWYHGYGNMIIVAHGGGVTTHYAHLSSFYVEVGTRVERGTIIGRAGSTGRATSAHLHYELRFDGNPLNPFQPLALDPSSDYFRQSRPPVDAGRGESTSLVAAPLRDK